MAFYVYIVTNKPDGVLYTGMTDDINRRMWKHREHMKRGFTDKYNCEMLVWYEVHVTRESVFERERRIKEWKRDWKIRLIKEMNPHWRDLAKIFFRASPDIHTHSIHTPLIPAQAGTWFKPFSIYIMRSRPAPG